MNNRYVYSIGGDFNSRIEKDLSYELVSIEMLDLYPRGTDVFEWQILNIRLQKGCWGIGAFCLNDKALLLFGGADSKDCSSDVFLLEQLTTTQSQSSSSQSLSEDLSCSGIC